MVVHLLVFQDGYMVLVYTIVLHIYRAFCVFKCTGKCTRIKIILKQYCLSYEVATEIYCSIVALCGVYM